MHVIIAGAGIGGLATALALHASGHEVTVFEAASRILPLGVGINLLPHAVEVLGELGLAEALLAQGVETREMVYFNRFGQRIWGEPRGRFAGHAAPQISLHRGALQGVLFDAAVERLGPDALSEAVEIDKLAGRHPVGQQGLHQPQLVQHLGRVGQEVDADPERQDAGRGLEHRHLMARGAQRQGRGQAADPGARDDYLHEVLP